MSRHDAQVVEKDAKQPLSKYKCGELLLSQVGDVEFFLNLFQNAPKRRRRPHHAQT